MANPLAKSSSDARGGAESGAIGADVGTGDGCKDDGGGIGPDVGAVAGCDVDGSKEVLPTKEILSRSINASSICKYRACISCICSRSKSLSRATFNNYASTRW
ncbi:hypothetical protein Syun_020735 [Stephania yunnanensis]|uniref:Uncharacterized protein n=1 Tax=Stephania yunnanensis TaxID=152371 RepID=A0AAP0IEG7_9MAGN